MNYRGARTTLISLLVTACFVSVQAQETRFDALTARVLQLYDEGKYAEAIPLALDAISEAETALGPEHSRTATGLNNLALLYSAQGNYADAERLYTRALRINEKLFGLDDPAVATNLSNLGSVLGKQGRLDDAEPPLKRALAIREKALGPNHRDVANSLNNLALHYEDQGKVDEAEPLYKRALEIRETVFGPDHPEVALILNNLAVLYQHEGKYGEAERLYKRALDIRERMRGPDHPEVATSLNNLASVYRAQGKYSDAQPLSERSLAIREKVLGANHLDLAISLDTMAALYKVQGKYGDAEGLYKRALAIREKALTPDHPDVTISLSNLAGLYQDQGKNGDAEALYKRALDIRQRVFGPDHAGVANSLNDLASLYRSQGKYREAELLSERALTMREKLLGADHPGVANSLNDVALIYLAQDKYGEAEPLLKRALTIREKVFTPNHPDVAVSLNNLAVLYRSQGKYSDAEPLMKRALEINENVFTADHPVVATNMNNVAEVYRLQDKHLDAESLYRRALAVKEKGLGPDHPDVMAILDNLALLYMAESEYPEAGRLLDRSLSILRDRMAYQFSFLSERDRLAYLKTILYSVPLLSSFTVSRGPNDPSLSGRLYDRIALAKGAVAQSVASLRTKIAASGDADAVRLFQQVTDRKREALRLSAAPTGNLEMWRKTVDRVQQEADDLQAQLARRIPAARTDGSLYATWQQVQAQLKPGDAAVEFVRFPFHDGKTWTTTTYYAGLVLTAEASRPPTFVLLGDAKDLECGALNDYSRIADRYGPYPCKQPQPDGSVIAPTKPTFYDAFWKPLEAALGNAKRIYVAPDGILNQVSFAIVPDDRGTLLLEKYDDLRMVLSTRDLLRPTRAPRENNAVLIGNPLFDLDQPARISAARTVARNHQRSGDSENTPTAASFGIDALRGTPFDPLDSTEKEITGVSALLQKQRWQTQSYTGTNAIVEVARQVHHPRVLHIATHGAFAPDSKIARTTASVDHPTLLDDPMLRSALFFTGANRFRRGEAPPAGLDDGVLTAYEATGLDLGGTELVVLSACETGLGSTQTGEGVFGLRRAFQEAGAEALLVSMWKVPDDATQELMQLFYTKWLGGAEKPRALRDAQLELRKKDPDPHSWGGFVLIGR